MNETVDTSGKQKPRWLRYVLFGVPIGGAAAFFIAGIVFWGGFNTAMEATNTLPFCTSCHEMRDTVFQEYRTTIHYHNRTGVRAVCSDCHVPDPWVHKFVRKIKASNELLHKVLGTIDTPEKFEARRLHLARNVWRTMKETDSRECRNCHNFQSMAPEFQRPRARQQHLNAIESGQTCIDCHKGIAHKDVRVQLTEEELEELEKPIPAHAREVPQSYLDSLAKIEAWEAEQAAKAEAEARELEERTQARIAAAVEAALAAAQDKPANSADGPPASGGALPEYDWSGVATQTITLFYPGQASYEWVQNGREHGGARPFTKGGDHCSTCHAKELNDMGTKIVTGTKLEPTPIPGKRPSIPVTVQAAHDADNLYLRFQWPNAPHTPVPFVDGGKMDPDNQVKLAMMIAGTGIDRVEQAGCWVTCHADNRYMPYSPGEEAIAELADISARLEAVDGITKYLSESRSKIEIRGRNDAPLGGWDKLLGEAEIQALHAQGTFMDVMRVNASGHAENGHILEKHVANDGTPVAGGAVLEGDTWSAVIVRPLVSDKPGDVTIEPGKTYTVGFAIHDDYTLARFHHVSLDLRLALDSAEAEINAVGK